MYLTLRVSKDPQNLLPPNTERVFDAQGGTIGRSRGNDLVLPDPERYLSSRHAAIYFENGQFFLADTSANGVFVNDSDTPVGADQAVPLHDGDRLTLGDYELVVGLSQGAATEPPQMSEPPESPAPPMPAARAYTPVANLAARPVGEETLDPLELLGAVSAPKRADAGGIGDLIGAERDDAPMLGSAFQPPRALSSPAIPDDWDADLPTPAPKAAPGPASPPARAPRAPAANLIPDDFDDLLAPAKPVLAKPEPAQPAAPPAPRRPAERAELTGPTERESEPRAGARRRAEGPKEAARPAPAPAPAPAPRTAATGVEADAGLAIFLDAAGLDASRIPAGQEAELLKLAGTMFRQLIEDLREVLIARALLKSGLRMEVTRIAPTDNNPLKFSAGGAEEALEKLLYKRGKGYMDPVQAIHEGFQDIKEHQLAMVAGVKAAAAAVIARFDPKRLEQEFDAKGGVGLLSSRKARNWELFEELYAQLKAAADDGRDEAFTDAFGSAYEEQIESLRKSRAG